MTPKKQLTDAQSLPVIKAIKGDYEVGNKKPPKSGQIQKGEVRNPLGAGAHKKVKLRKDISALFMDIANETVEGTVNGKKQKVARIKAIGLRLSSDPKYMVAFLEWATGGKLPQAVEVKGEINTNIISIVKHDDND